MNKLSLILTLLILSSCTGAARQQETLEFKNGPLVHLNDEVTEGKAGSRTAINSYLDKVRTKVRQNWNPPPDSKGAMARLEFSINRLGRVMNVRLIEDSSGSFKFKKAALLAILSSNPFPPLPEEIPMNLLKISLVLTEGKE